MYDGLKKGDKIKCGSCKAVIFIAAKDIPFGADMASHYLTYASGRPVEYGAELICPACDTRFQSISTVEAMTF